MLFYAKMDVQSEKCPPSTPLPKKRNTKKWLSLPLGKKESKRKQNVDVDTEQVVFDCVKSNLEKKKHWSNLFQEEVVAKNQRKIRDGI